MSKQETAKIRAVGWSITDPKTTAEITAGGPDIALDEIADVMSRYGLQSAEVRVTYTRQTAWDIVGQAWRSYPEARYIFVSRDVYEDLLRECEQDIAGSRVSRNADDTSLMINGARIKMAAGLPERTAVAGV